MKTKKILAFALSILMIISVLPHGAFAAPRAITVINTADEAESFDRDNLEAQLKTNASVMSAQDVDLSTLSEITENTSDTKSTYSYTLTVEEINEDTVRTLNLTLDGANINTLTLPNRQYGVLNINIITKNDSRVETLSQSYLHYTQWNTVTFGGEGNLEIAYLELQGGENNHSITISEGAKVSITGNSLYAVNFGSSGSNNSTLNVDGKLVVNGSVSCGQTIIGSTGNLICKRLQLGGDGANDADFAKNSFVLKEGGRFEAKGERDWYDDETGEFYAALSVDLSDSDSMPVAEIIVLPDGVLPAGYSLYKSDAAFATVDDGDEIPKDKSGVIYAATSLVFPQVKTYTVTWNNHNGTPLETDFDVESGTMPEYNGQTPTKDSSAEYTYTFEGWTPDISSVTEDKTYTAKFKETKNKYTITFVNHDGTPLSSEELEYGVLPVYSGQTPTKDATVEYTYTFEGWTPDISEVTGEKTYTAKFKETPVLPPASYTVSFNSNGGSNVADQTVNDGEKITKPTNPRKSGYSFVGWYTDTNLTQIYIFSTPVTQNFTLYAKWRKSGGGGGGGGVTTTYYTVKFETYDGTEIVDKRVKKNSKLEKPQDPVKRDCIFDGWYSDDAFENPFDFETKITKNLTLHAKWRKQNVSDTLNVKEHFAYINGYDDNTVRPENNITRAETAQIFFRLLNEKIRNENETTQNVFADVEENDWYNIAVSTLKKMGIINGRTDMYFAPDSFITRAEFAAISARFDKTEVDISHSFNDISGHWAQDEILKAASLGWIEGYQDGKFAPDEFITRAEAITLVNRMLGRTPKKVDDLLGNMIRWSDNSDEKAWYYIAIQEATNNHSYIIAEDESEKWQAES